jgi:AcrR family transcriptional regulator
VGKGSVYRQFGSKEELYAAAVIDGFAQVQAQIRAALPHCESARERIATVVRQALDFFWNRRQFFTLMRDPRALGPRRSQQYRAHRQELSRLVTAILDDGIRTGEIARGLETRVAAEALLGMLRGINRYSRDYTDPARAAASLTALFFDGCAARRRA